MAILLVEVLISQHTSLWTLASDCDNGRQRTATWTFSEVFCLGFEVVVDPFLVRWCKTPNLKDITEPEAEPEPRWIVYGWREGPSKVGWIYWSADSNSVIIQAQSTTALQVPLNPVIKWMTSIKRKKTSEHEYNDIQDEITQRQKIWNKIQQQIWNY